MLLLLRYQVDLVNAAHDQIVGRRQDGRLQAVLLAEVPLHDRLLVSVDRKRGAGRGVQSLLERVELVSRGEND